MEVQWLMLMLHNNLKRIIISFWRYVCLFEDMFVFLKICLKNVWKKWKNVEFFWTFAFFVDCFGKTALNRGLALFSAVLKPHYTGDRKISGFAKETKKTYFSVKSSWKVLWIIMFQKDAVCTRVFIVTLAHEVGNNSVERWILEPKTFFTSTKSPEIFSSVRNHIRSQFHDDSTNRISS